VKPVRRRNAVEIVLEPLTHILYYFRSARFYSFTKKTPSPSPKMRPSTHTPQKSPPSWRSSKLVVHTACCLSLSLLERRVNRISKASRRPFFNAPFCSLESPTCHTCVPYGRPITTNHFVFGSLTYCRNARSNRLLCPSSRRTGRGPFSVRGNSSRLSMNRRRSVSISPVIPP
jgi:hypothetical protein